MDSFYLYSVEIDGKACTLEFTDALQTVLLNGRPFKVEFGGLPFSIIVQNKKHFIRFSVLPRGFRAGYVKLTGMKGEQAKENPADRSCTSGAGPSTAGALSTTATSTLSVPPGLDLDSSSQDGMDIAAGSRPGTYFFFFQINPTFGLGHNTEFAESLFLCCRHAARRIILVRAIGNGAIIWSILSSRDC